MTPRVRDRPATVVVIGPPLSGVGGVVDLLGERLDGCVVLEATGLVAGQRPDVVVFLASAAAPMGACELAMFAGAAARTDAVVAAVTKIDVHRSWPAVLEANRNAVQQRLGRHRAVFWAGVAARTEIGPPVVDDLLAGVRAELADEHLDQRNCARAEEWLRGKRLARRRAAREQAVRGGVARVQIQQTRIELGGRARQRCVRLHAELQEGAAALAAKSVRDWTVRADRLAMRAVEEFEGVIAERLADLCRTAGIAAHRAAPVAPQFPPLRTAAAEDRLAAILGTGFGLGVTFTLGRLVVDAAPAGAAAALLPVCGAAGLALTGWVIRTRRLLAVRGAAVRRAAEVAALVRGALDERVLAIESVLLTALLEGSLGSRGGVIIPVDDGSRTRVNLLSGSRPSRGSRVACSGKTYAGDNR